MPISKNFTSVYSHQWEINFTQCAPNGYLKYVDLCNLLQLTAAEHSIIGGLSFNDMQVFDQAWVLSRIRIEISAMPKWQDTVIVKTWIESLQGSGSVRNIEMYLNEQKIVGASTYWAVLNTKLRKSEALALPHEHFEKFPLHQSTVKGLSRINVLKETDKIGTHTVVLSDLDIVNHANNVKYLEWCLDCAAVKSVLANDVKSLEMNFLRELNHGDEVEVHFAKEDVNDYYSIVKEGKVCFALQLSY